jgi:hypothetical protein
MFLSCRNPVASFDIDVGVFPCCVTFVYPAHHLHGINDLIRQWSRHLVGGVPVWFLFFPFLAVVL